MKDGELCIGDDDVDDDDDNDDDTFRDIVARAKEV